MTPTLYELYRQVLRLRIEVAAAEHAAARAAIKQMDKRQ